jgi:hypothetical protein
LVSPRTSSSIGHPICGSSTSIGPSHPRLATL